MDDNIGIGDLGEHTMEFIDNPFVPGIEFDAELQNRVASPENNQVLTDASTSYTQTFTYQFSVPEAIGPTWLHARRAYIGFAIWRAYELIPMILTLQTHHHLVISYRLVQFFLVELGRAVFQISGIHKIMLCLSMDYKPRSLKREERRLCS